MLALIVPYDAASCAKTPSPAPWGAVLEVLA